MSKTIIAKLLEENKKFRESYLQEKLIQSVTESLWAIVEQRGFSKSDLARELKVSRARIGKLFDGTSNVTLRTIADISRVLDVEPEFNFVDKTDIHEVQWIANDADYALSGATPITTAARRVRYRTNGAAA